MSGRRLSHDNRRLPFVARLGLAAVEDARRDGLALARFAAALVGRR